MTKDDLKRSLEQLFSDFAPPDPEMERQSSARDDLPESVDQVASGGHQGDEKDREHKQSADGPAKSGLWRQGWQNLASHSGNDGKSHSEEE